MEFTRLADVEVVETATDVDKVLIEQNGEIKRVPKTEVGGSGSNTLTIHANMDTTTGEVTVSANITFDEAFAALANCELGGVAIYVAMIADGQVMTTALDVGMCADYSIEVGFPSLMVMSLMTEIRLIWTADGFSVM